MLADETSEVALLIAASCGLNAAAFDQLLAADIDWTRLIELSLHHRTTGFLQSVLARANSRMVPPEILDALGSYVEAMRTQEAQLMSELWFLLKAFSDASIPVVPFKGPLLRWHLHGRHHVGQPGDLDLLLSRRHVASARRLLEARGYEDLGQRPGQRPLTDVQRRMYERVHCEYGYSHPSGVVVEPHWEFCQRVLAINIDYEGMLERSTTQEIDRHVVRVLSPQDLALALCVHGAKHRWSRLAWMADFVALLRTLSPQDVDSVSRAAREHGCALMWRVSLAIASRCGGVQVPAASEQCDLGRVAALAALVIEGFNHPEWEEPRNDRVDGFRLNSRERFADRARYVFRTLVTPRRPHIESAALPELLRGLYYPIKIGTDIAMLVRGSVHSGSGMRKSAQEKKKNPAAW